MSGWHEARLLATTAAASGLWTVRVDVSGTALVGTHTLPGQYLLVDTGEAGEGVFAIASPPDSTGAVFELLVKEGSQAADALVRLPPGATVRVAEPAGPGFPLERARGKRVLLFATGSGISAIRSVIGAIARERGHFGDVTLYFGARSPSAFAYRDELESWEKSGIRVLRTISQPDAQTWEGTTGYVQAQVGEEALHEAVAFICGQPEMVEAVRDTLVRRGLSEENIFLNV